MGVFRKALKFQHHPTQTVKNSNPGQTLFSPLKFSNRPIFILRLINSHEPTRASIVMRFSPLKKDIKSFPTRIYAYNLVHVLKSYTAFSVKNSEFRRWKRLC